MSTPAPRRRKSAAAPGSKLVKASISIDVGLHARWAAAAALRGMDRSAFAVEAIRDAVQGIIVVDKRKNAVRTEIKDRLDEASPLDLDDEIAA